ncbi:MAG: hypothetical protein SNG10_01320 [Rikenellaceae bacterium]
MRVFLSFLFIIISNVSILAQQRIDIVNGGTSNSKDEYATKIINGEERTSAMVVIQSNTKLKYSIMDVVIPEEDIHHSVDDNYIYVDSINIYVTPFDSKRRISIFAQNHPSEIIDVNMTSSTTYNYMVIAPNNDTTEIVEEDVESYDRLISQGRAAMNEGMYEYAESIFERAAMKSQTDEVYALLAFSQLKQASFSKRTPYDNAIYSASKALALNKSNYLANIAMGAAISDRGIYKHKLSTLSSVSMKLQKAQKQAAYEEVIQYMKTAIELSEKESYPSNVWDIDIYFVTGNAYHVLKNDSMTREYMQKVTGQNKYRAERVIYKLYYTEQAKGELTQEDYVAAIKRVRDTYSK